MRDELEMKLAEEFSFMHKGLTLAQQRANGRINDLYSAFGCDCRDGWYELLRSLCTEITQAYAEAGLPVDIVIDQIKEKFGTLRFYYHIKGKPSGVQAIDFLGQGSVRMMPEGEDIHQTVREIVSRYEEKSGEVCEECGKAGVLRTNLSWIQTLCDDCVTLVEERRKNRRLEIRRKMEEMMAQRNSNPEETHPEQEG